MKVYPKFKIKVVLEALKEWHSLAQLTQKYEIYPTQISVWKRDFLDGADQVFESGKKDARSETELNLKLMREVDEHYLHHPFKGAKRKHIWLTRGASSLPRSSPIMFWVREYA